MIMSRLRIFIKRFVFRFSGIMKKGIAMLCFIASLPLLAQQPSLPANYLVKSLNDAAFTYGISQFFDNGDFIGLGTSTPKSKLHIHSDEMRMSDNIVVNEHGSTKSLPSIPLSQYYAITTFQITNHATDSLATDGLLMGVKDKNAIFTLQEDGDMYFILDDHTIMSLLNAGKVGINGSVGIGTNNPLSDLHVTGNGIFSETANAIISSAFIRGNNTFSSSANPDYTWFNNDMTGMFHPAADVIAFTNGGTESMRIDKTNVGIGTVTPHPDYRLSVNGKIRAKEIVVETNWSDFVFEKDYKLMPLPEVEKYINEHHHLPGVPSAAEVEKNGVALGNSQAVLLQKIEELTVYIIEMNKQLELVKAQNVSLQNEINELKNLKQK